MKLYEKIGSFLIVVVILLSTIVVAFSVSADENLFVNGDFSNGLNGYELSDNKSHNEAISVKNGACYIPLLTSTVAADKPYNRWINQKVALKNGKYVFSFDLDITYTTASNWAFAYAVREEGGIDIPIIRPTNGAAPSHVTVSAPVVENLNYVLNTANAASAAGLNGFALSGASKYYNYSGTAGRQVGKVSFEVTVNNPNAETTKVYFSMGCYANVCSAYIDNISLVKKKDESEEPAGILNGDFSDGLKGYEISGNKSHNEAISVKNGACYIPFLTSTVAADKPYNRWINQKVALKNGTYIFSFDLDITYTTANNWAFAYAVRGESGIDRPIIRPTNGATTSNVSVGAPVTESLNYVLNSADQTNAAKLNGFALSNTSKYYNYSGTVGRQVGKVSFEVTVDNPNAETTSIYFSMGCYANACFAYVDNISISEFDPTNDNKAIDVTKANILTMDNDDFSKLNISDSNQVDGNEMKMEIVQSGETTHGNVLKLPTYSGTSSSDKVKSARFYTKYINLTVGKTYTVNFDMKMPSFEKGSASQWLGLVGISHKEPALQNSATFPSSTMLPSKITAYTDKGTNTPVSLGTFTNWSSGVFQWNYLGSEEWINYSIDFVAEEKVAYFFIENYLSGISDFYVDNISVSTSSSQLDGIINITPTGNDSIVPAPNSKNVLIIGNSFASHTLSAPLLNVINADDAKLNVARYGKGAMSPGYFAGQISNDRVNMEFSYAGKGNTSIYSCKGNVSRDSVKNFADWDYVLVQAFTVGQTGTQNWSEVASLVAAVRNYIANSNTKIIVWVPQSVSQSYCDANFNGADASKYKNYHDALATDLENNISNGTVEADGIFNVNETFWIARKHLGADGLHIDGLHINSTGAYLMGLAIHKLVFETDPTEFNLKIHANTAIDNALKQAVNGVDVSVASGTIVNGDFSDELNGYDISANKSHNEAISVKNGVCYIPKSTSTVTSDKPYNRWINQKVALKNGTYTVSFDLDITYTATNAFSFAYAIRNGNGLDLPIMRPTSGAAPANVKVCDPELETLNYTLNTSDTTPAKSLAEGGFAISNTSKYYNFSGKQGTRYVGKVSFVIQVNNPNASTTALYISMGCYSDACSGYIDNLTLTEGGFVNSPFAFDFETGGTEGIVYRESDPAYSHRINLKRTDEEAKQGKYSLVSTAISDEETSGNKVRGSFGLPITDLEKNKNYELSFWFKFKGSDETLRSGFRVAKDTAGTDENSLVSSASKVNYSSDLQFSDPKCKKAVYGWASFIALTNKNKGSDWVRVSIKFNTGDNSTVYLQFVNFAKKGTTFYIDDILYSVFDGELPVQPIAKYDYENTLYEISFDEDASIPLDKYGDSTKHYKKSSKFAHSGKYSVEWDAYHDDGWEVLNFTDKVGNVARDPVLQPNTVYRFSCWMYAVGTGSKDTRAAWNSPVEAKQQSQVIVDVSGDWQQFTYTFSTEIGMTSCPVEFAVGISGLQYEGLKVYVDDIKLEKLVCSILATDTEDNYCEDIVNYIDNGNFEEAIQGSIWNANSLNISLIKETNTSLAPSGLYYANVKGYASLKVRIRLKSGYEYKFMCSYKTNKNSDFKIGILDDNGKELQPAYQSGVNHTGLLTPKADGEWHREGYTFFTPASGYVYFYLSGKNADVYLDAISLYKSRLTYETDPNTYDGDISLSDLEIKGEMSSDFSQDDLSDFEDSFGDSTDDETVVSQGRYKKIRRIYTTSWWIYALIIAGGVIAVGGITVLTVILIKKKRRAIK